MSCFFSFWIYPVWNSLGFLELGGYLFSPAGEVFNYNLLKYFLISFFFSSPGTPLIQMLVCLILSQRSMRLFSFIFILFFQYSTMLQLFSTFDLPAYLSVLLLIPVVYFLNFISVSMMFIVDFLFFISSRFLNVSCIFSIHASILYIVPPFYLQGFELSLLSLL